MAYPRIHKDREILCRFITNHGRSCHQTLKDWQNNKLNTSFGSICAKHMPHFECYRKYLMDQEEAQKLHVKEVKSNQKYRKFLAKAKENPAFRRRKLQDILVEPVQRISRYTMMLKEILKRTAQDSKEHEELTDACNISSRIAKMKDDTPTKLATMSLSLYTSIKDSPCSLISQHRELIDYMDFVEINRETSKPIRAVTLFLFNDKLLIASRPSNAKGADLCNIIEKENTSILSKVGMLKPLDRSSRRDASLKFKAWADIEQIELVGGTSDFVGSFFLHTLPAPQQENVPFSTLGSFEAYLHKGTRMYTPIPHKDYTLTADGIKALLKRKDEFIEAFHRTQALARNSEEQKIAYYREWAGKDAYITLHDTDSYHSARYKVIRNIYKTDLYTYLLCMLTGLK
ncbi:Dbl homology domain-containing protein [Spinellus fusiger]|nr:Dbl homology domain-containing protein [Spinellus fusiger]